MEIHGQYPITLVTAYFDLGGKPGWPEDPYPDWIRNFLSRVRWPLVIFCDWQSLGMLKDARGDRPAVYHVTSLEEFAAYKYFDDLRARYMSRLRAGEKPPCTPEAALIYHQKCDFLRQALSENPFGSEMLFWCDIGQFRLERKSRLICALRMRFRLLEDAEWPNLRICRALPQDKAIVVTGSGFPVEGAPINGRFFGGAVEPARRWCDAYYQLLDETWREGKVVYIDEWLMGRLRAEQPRLVYALPHDIGWLRPAVFLANHLVGGWLTFWWYLLSGKRFPWGYFRSIFFGPRGDGARCRRQNESG